VQTASKSGALSSRLDSEHRDILEIPIVLVVCKCSFDIAVSSLTPIINWFEQVISETTAETYIFRHRRVENGSGSCYGGSPTHPVPYPGNTGCRAGAALLGAAETLCGGMYIRELANHEYKIGLNDTWMRNGGETVPGCACG
jgi:hypothetical protein